MKKIGTTIDTVMIDEFQDTSRMQWENFHLLLQESLAQKEGSLIVGDIKQSIYRWRNGDWKILAGWEMIRVSGSENAVWEPTGAVRPTSSASTTDCSRQPVRF